MDEESRKRLESLGYVAGSVKDGNSLSSALGRHPGLFSNLYVGMVKSGEESGTLDVTLMAVAQSYETEVAEKTRALIGMIQPAMTIFMGLMVGVIALSMVSAMYSIYGQMG